MPVHTMGHTFMLAATASAIPAYAVMIAGIVLAIVRWKAHPRASVFAIIGLACLLFIRLLGYGVNAAIAYLFSRGVPGASGFVIAMGAICGLLTAGCWALILAAIFCKRPVPEPASPVGHCEEIGGGVV